MWGTGISDAIFFFNFNIRILDKTVMLLFLALRAEDCEKEIGSEDEEMSCSDGALNDGKDASACLEDVMTTEDLNGAYLQEHDNPSQGHSVNPKDTGVKDHYGKDQGHRC